MKIAIRSSGRKLFRITCLARLSKHFPIPIHRSPIYSLNPAPSGSVPRTSSSQKPVACFECSKHPGRLKTTIFTVGGLIGFSRGLNCTAQHQNEVQLGIIAKAIMRARANDATRFLSKERTASPPIINHYASILPYRPSCQLFTHLGNAFEYAS